MIFKTLQILIKPLFNNLKQEKPVLTQLNRQPIFKLFHKMTDEPVLKCAKPNLLIGTHDGKAPAQITISTSIMKTKKST